MEVDNNEEVKRGENKNGVLDGLSLGLSPEEERRLNNAFEGMHVLRVSTAVLVAVIMLVVVGGEKYGRVDLDSVKDEVFKVLESGTIEFLSFVSDEADR